jgi:hypothetical protein
MAKEHFASCPSCARHVRVSEATCPFCRVTLSDAFRTLPARRSPGARLSRAALYALGTGSVTLATACTTNIVPRYGTSVMGDAGAPVDTGPAASDGGATIDAGAPFHAGTVAPVYRAPPFPHGG